MNRAEGRGSTSAVAKIIVFLAIQSYVVKMMERDMKN
jgi:hypothetical protein